jgi:hypothetical protein
MQNRGVPEQRTIPDWDRAGKPDWDRRFWAECVADLFKVVMGSLTRNSSNEAPITKTEWALFQRIRSAADAKYPGFPPIRLPLDHVKIEFAFTSYIRRWQDHRLKPGEYGRGVSLSGGNDLWVFTGVVQGLKREHVDVKKDIGPWNAELRRMFAELKTDVGEDAIWPKILYGIGPWTERELTDLVIKATKQELLQPALPLKPTLPEAQLTLARKVVEECRKTGQHTTGVPSSRSFFQKILG